MTYYVKDREIHTRVQQPHVSILINLISFLRQGQVRFPMHLYELYTFEWENC